jgi:glycosyltransferase involved in cell wall biosynthesis
VTTVLVFAPVFAPARRGGGPIRTLGALVDEAPGTFDVHVLTSDREARSNERLPVEPLRWVARGDARVMYLPVRSPRRLLAGYLGTRDSRPSVLYFNSFFNARLSILPQVLARVGVWGAVSTLIAPRGEFGAGALHHHRRRKRLFIRAYRLAGLHRGVVWHASSHAEAADIRREWGREARVITRENETGLPDVALRVGHPAPDGRLRIAFLSRLTALKGLAIALEALAVIRSPVRFDVYGPEEDPSYVEHCRALAAALPPTAEVRFLSLVDPENVRRVLSGYDLLVLPTAGENFGQVIAEALSASTPVMCTPTTPWSDVLRSGGGVIVSDREPESWAMALTAFAALSPKERQQAKRRAGEAYEAWQQRERPPHVFELLRTAGGNQEREAGSHR